MTAQRAGSAPGGRIRREDIESKLREIRHQVDDTTESAKPAGLAVVAGVAVAVVALAYVLGRRRGRKGRTVVEVRRV